jgi:hypothetical protein
MKFYVTDATVVLLRLRQSEASVTRHLAGTKRAKKPWLNRFSKIPP